MRMKRIDIRLTGARSLTLYAGSKIASALNEVTRNLDFYEGVKLSQVLEAVYSQGKKDGAQSAIDSLTAALEGVKAKVSNVRRAERKRRLRATRKKC